MELMDENVSGNAALAVVVLTTETMKGTADLHF